MTMNPESEPNHAIPPTPSQAEYKKEPVRPMGWLKADEPISLFQKWLLKAGESETHDPNAMSLATVDKNGLPDVRIVLLKGLDERGFVFYTNGQSAKGEQLAFSGKAALCFHWKSQKRQVRVRGAVEHVSEAESDAYFAKRSRGSQIGAWASQQSRPVDSRKTMLEAVKVIEAKFAGGDVVRPQHWHGWRVKPDMIEFWQDGAFRLHDRLIFTPNIEMPGKWVKTRLFP